MAVGSDAHPLEAGAWQLLAADWIRGGKRGVAVGLESRPAGGCWISAAGG